MFADEFSQAILPPTNIVEHLIPIGPVHPPHSFDEDFTLYEFRAALDMRRRRSAPGENGITYKALQNLDQSFYHVVLDMYNMVWRTGVIPLSWHTSIVCPVLKRGKDPQDICSYRPISLTSCTGKVMETMVEQRLSWLLENRGVFPEAMTGFRRHRSTADSIAGVVSSLEKARAARHPVYLVFLDIHGAFESLPHVTIIRHLRHSGACGRML